MKVRKLTSTGKVMLLLGALSALGGISDRLRLTTQSKSLFEYFLFAILSCTNAHSLLLFFNRHFNHFTVIGHQTNGFYFHIGYY